MSLNFGVRDKRLSISLPRTNKSSGTREIDVEYHGAPRRGIRFFPEREQVYTVFFTSQWLPCIDAPDDKATFRLRLILPNELTAVANGRLVGKTPTANNKLVHVWNQEKGESHLCIWICRGTISNSYR